jgi:cytochrome d ubiquinol oxidase subunit I
LEEEALSKRWFLWILMFSFPFPYIANNRMDDCKRQAPWLIYGLLKTADGFSSNVSSGNALFTLIGFSGLYLLIGLLFIMLVLKEINHGPEYVSHKSATKG